MTSVRARIATAATIIMLGNVGSRLLGLVREQVIAGLFGPTATTSAFVAASTVPTMVYDLLIGGAISAALIPVFSDYRKGDDDAELGSVAGGVLIWTFGVLVVAVALLELLAPQVVSILAGGLAPEAQSEALTMVRVVLPCVVFLGLSGITTAILYSRQSFTYPAFCVAAYNGGIILFAFAFASRLGATSLALGVLAGAFFQLAFQLPGLRGMPLSFVSSLRHPALSRILKLYAPVAIGLVVTQIGVAIDRNFASRTGEDSLAVMRFATTLIQFPLGLIVTATSFAVLPTLARAGAPGGAVAVEAQDSLESFKGTLVIGLKLVLLAIIPAAVGLTILREPIIRLLFQHGVFDAYGTERTALAFLYYAPQLPFVAVDQLLIFAFYARKNTITPMLIGVLGVIVYVVLGMALMGSMGMAGLVLANTVQNSLHGVILFILIERAVGSIRGYGLGPTVFKSAIAALAMFVAYLILNPYLSGAGASEAIRGQVTYLVTMVGILAVVYLLLLHVLRVEETRLWWRAVRARFG
ncbi:MAG: murein biosynthesis integral membrane protein MurJ [Chloroflexi bacterium]|nr:murein biosynthesis integral membrane protein MurJ [Chloroflexota bacterium]